MDKRVCLADVPVSESLAGKEAFRGWRQFIGSAKPMPLGPHLWKVPHFRHEAPAASFVAPAGAVEAAKAAIAAALRRCAAFQSSGQAVAAKGGWTLLPPKLSAADLEPAE